VPSATAVNSFNINISCVPDKYQHTFAKFSRKIVSRRHAICRSLSILKPVALQALEQFFYVLGSTTLCNLSRTDSQSDDDNNDMLTKTIHKPITNTYNDNNNSNILTILSQ